MSTHFPSADAARAARQWWILDATGVPLGRLSSVAAQILSGKTKATWTPFLDTGDFVVVINAEKAALTGRKEQGKVYIHHTGYPGGFQAESAERLRARKPSALVQKAILGMLPKTKLGRAMGKKLKVYAGAIHPHGAQAPRAIDVKAPRGITA